MYREIIKNSFIAKFWSLRNPAVCSGFQQNPPAEV